MSEGVKTRAMAVVEKKGGEVGKQEGSVLTKPTTTAVREDGEVSDSESPPPTKKKKRKAMEGHVFVKPTLVPVKKKKGTVKSRAKSTSVESSPRTKSVREKQTQSKANMRRDLKIDKMFQWFKEMKQTSDRERSVEKSKDSESKHRDRSRSRSYTRSRSRSRDSSRSRGSYHASSSSYRSSSSRDHQFPRSEVHIPDRREHKEIRESRRALHSMSSSDYSRDSDQDTIRLPDEEFNLHRARLVLGISGSTTGEPPSLPRVDEDPLEQRISSTIAENVPKPTEGPHLTARVGSLMSALVAKPEYARNMKICEKYPRPGNVPELVTPELTQDVDKTIDQKVIKEDRRLKSCQMCSTASTSALGRALDLVLVAKQQVPSLSKVGDILVDCISLNGYMHAEYSSLRIKGFKQTVNPSYSDVFSAKPEEPTLLMGKAPISEQMKSVDDLLKIKNKLKKPEHQNPSQRGFRKGGDFKRKGNQQFQRTSKGQYFKRRFDDRKTRQTSPRRYFPRRQSGSNENYNRNTSFQDDKKVSSRKN